MKAKEFRKQLLFALDNLTDRDVERTRQELRIDTDYEIDSFGFTHIVKTEDEFQEEFKKNVESNMSVLNKVLQENYFSKGSSIKYQPKMKVSFEVIAKEKSIEKPMKNLGINYSVSATDDRVIEENVVSHSKKMRKAA